MRRELLLTAIFGVGVFTLPALALEELSEEELAEISAKGTQIVVNNDDPDNVQNNNNDSVQLNDNAQQSILAFSVMNLSVSAGNQSANLASVSGTGEDVDVEQDTFQLAVNVVEISYQEIYNEDDPDALQNNNNASVQLNASAQQNAVSFHNLNASASAVNQAAQGVAVTDTGEDVDVDQHIDQSAVNVSSAEQVVTNNGPSTDFAEAPQNNNNSSVQLNDDAQQNVIAFTLGNLAGSAANQASNLTFIENTGEDVEVDQHADQFALNIVTTSQTVVNEEDIDGIQNNNNGSVQLNANAQQNMTVFQAVNAADSALNQAANLVGISGTGEDVDVHQSVDQTAINLAF